MKIRRAKPGTEGKLNFNAKKKKEKKKSTREIGVKYLPVVVLWKDAFSSLGLFFGLCPRRRGLFLDKLPRLKIFGLPFGLLLNPTADGLSRQGLSEGAREVIVLLLLRAGGGVATTPFVATTTTSSASRLRADLCGGWVVVGARGAGVASIIESAVHDWDDGVSDSPLENMP